MKCEFCSLEKAAPCRTQAAAGKCNPSDAVKTKAYFARSAVDTGGGPVEVRALGAIGRSLGPNTELVELKDIAAVQVVVIMALPGGEWFDADTWFRAETALASGKRVYEVQRHDDGLMLVVDRLNPARCLSQETSRYAVNVAMAVKAGL